MSLPEITPDEFYALRAEVGAWLRIKVAHEGRWTVEQRQVLTQIAADVEHSSLLYRMLVERKSPLSEPPPLEHAYPVYPRDDA